MKKIYISGKITGLEFDKAKYNFNTAAILIKSSGEYIPINPFDISPIFGLKLYWCYLVSDLFELCFCDAIYMLKNYNDSRGAKIELRFAKFLGLKIFYESNC